MLYIFEPLKIRTEEFVKAKGINADVYSQIGKCWHQNRYIQIVPQGMPRGVHYEYTNGFWELHFERELVNDEVDLIRKKLISLVESTNYMGWHNRWKMQRGLLRLESEVNEDTFESLFEEFWNATNQLLFQNIEQDRNSTTDSKNDSLSVRDALDFTQQYKEPDEPKILSVSDLPFERFTIPPYQRPYKWNIKNVNQLIDDIITFCDKGTEEYRLGTLVLHKRGTDATSPLDIVDGQQRSITLMLLLNELSKVDYQEEIFSQEFCDSMKSFLSKKQFHDSVSMIHIQENINAIRYRIPELTKKYVKFLLNNCCLVVISLYDISEAFQFFDSQNARGKELEPHDLLKAFHLREIPQMRDVDKKNIEDWERLDTPVLSSLFLVLFRIKRWIDAKEGRFFTSQKVDSFKGPKSDDYSLPYQKIFIMADCYAQLYNSDIARRLDKQFLEFPHQIDQITINGTLFFDMIRYYSHKIKEVDNVLKTNSPEIYKALSEYKEKDRTGDKYTRSLFDAALLFYYDKFGLAGIDKAIQKIFVWAYSMRLCHEIVKLATMDNLACEGNSFFRILHRSIRPADILNWRLTKLAPANVKQKGMQPIKTIFTKLSYLEEK